MPLRSAVLEREHELAVLLAALDEAARGRGSVVLVAGEAGLGKSSLVAALAGEVTGGVAGGAAGGAARLLVGRCDDLATPRVLGALRDLAGAVGADLARALRSPGDRDPLFTALRDELDWSGHASVLVVEDVHWADEATLDVLRWLAARVASLPAVLVLTYRDDEVGDGHPLRRLLAGTATLPVVRRLALRPLSAGAVAALAGPTGADAAAVLALTAGNPFLVHEVLASGEGVPASVVDLVQARLHRLDPGARDAVERIGVVTSPVGRDLVEALVPGGLAALADAERHGLVAVEPRRVTFRHELTRRALVDALPAARRTALEAAVLAALEATGADPALLVHHAREAGDAAAVVRHGPAAARAASTGRAHRQAAEHLRDVLVHRDLLAPEQLAELLEASAVECYTVGDLGRSALADQVEAVGLRRALGDARQLGPSLRWLSRIAWWVGDRPTAERAGAEAVAVLSPLDDARELALALSNTSQLAMLAERMEEAVAPAERAIALARDLDDAAVLSHALNNLGTARWGRGDESGRALVEESRAVALAAGLPEHASRAWCNLVWQLLVHLRPREAAAELVAGIAHAETAEQVVFWKYLHVERALVALAEARWDDAAADARTALDATSPIRCTALFVLGRVALRTGADATAMVAECARLGGELDELQRTAPAAALACEAAWLAGDHDVVRRTARPVLEAACRAGSLAWRTELAHWLALAGDPVEESVLAACADHPHALSARGHWAQAAQAWRQHGYPYEAAAAQALDPDPATALAGLSALDAVGGTALAAKVRADLRRRGVGGVPRGPSPTTRAHVAGLTARQLDVLDLLDAGLTSPEMAERLVLSVRTVDHHVAAVMDKLGVTSRADAAARARDLGWPGGGGRPG